MRFCERSSGILYHPSHGIFAVDSGNNLLNLPTNASEIKSKEGREKKYYSSQVVSTAAKNTNLNTPKKEDKNSSPIIQVKIESERNRALSSHYPVISTSSPLPSPGTSSSSSSPWLSSSMGVSLIPLVARLVDAGCGILLTLARGVVPTLDCLFPLGLLWPLSASSPTGNPPFHSFLQCGHSCERLGRKMPSAQGVWRRSLQCLSVQRRPWCWMLGWDGVGGGRRTNYSYNFSACMTCFNPFNNTIGGRPVIFMFVVFVRRGIIGLEQVRAEF